MKAKIALVVSHPIQHFCPQYVSFAKISDIEFKVFFASTLGLQKYKDPNFLQEISWGNLHLEKFDHVFLNGDKALPSDKSIDAPGLETALAEFQPETVIIYGYFQRLQRRAHRWALENKVKLAYISDSELRHKRNPIKALVQRFFLRRFFRDINFFLSVGNANEEFYRYHGVQERKLVRMHFPIDISSYELAFQNKEILREQIRSTYQISASEIVLSVVGKLVSWKNQDHLIDAVEQLGKKGMIVHLLIIGSGPMMDNWKEKASKVRNGRVHFTGFVPIENLPAYYAATDIYVHPASVEPHSIAVSEAIYMGCPVVLSDTCGSYGESDDVQPGRNGFVYKFGEIDKMVEHLEVLISDNTLRNAFACESVSISRNFQKKAHEEVMLYLR